MQQRDFGFLACRILALYFGADALRQLPHAAESWSHVDVFGLAYVIQRSSAVGFGIAAALLLWNLADKISTHLLPRRGPSEPQEKIDAGGALTIGLIIVGVMTTVDAMPWLVHDLYSQAHSSEWKWKGMILRRGLQLGIGLWLVLGARGWAEAIRRLRKNPPDAA